MLTMRQGGSGRILDRLECTTNGPLPHLLLQQPLSHWVHKTLRPRECTRKTMGFQRAFPGGCQVAVLESAGRRWVGVGGIQGSEEVDW